MKKIYFFAFMALCNLAFPQMIAKYDFSGNANDLSGNGHNGNLMGGTTFTADRFGNAGSACFFNGSGDYIDMGVMSLNSMPLTISLWCQRPSIDNAAHCLIGQSMNQIANNSLNLMLTELINPPHQSVGFDIYADGVYDTTGAASLAWENWCFSFDGTSSATIYRNGQAIKTGSITSYYQGGGNVYVGTTGWISDFFHGSIDDIRMWGQQLTSVQIDSIYQAERTPGGLIARYDFSGNTIDGTGHGHDGTPYGASLTTDRNGNSNSAYFFNGAGDAIDCGPMTLNNTNFSVGFWAKHSSIDPNFHALFSQGNTNAADDGLHIGLTGTMGGQKAGLDFWFDGYYDTTGASSLEWNHWFFTYDRVSHLISIYRNGSFVSSGSAGTYLGSGNVVLGEAAWGGNYFNGALDEVKVYDLLLSGVQIDSIYRAEKPACAPFGLSSMITDVTCHALANGMVSISSTSGITPFTFAWTGGQTSNPATGLSGGNYTVVVTDAIGCKDSVSMFINEPTQITTVLSATSTTCYGGTDGMTDAQVAGGTPPYMFSWSPVNATTATVTNLNAGTYTCTITDANDCSAWDSVTVYQPAPYTANMTVTSGTVCVGEPDTLNVSVSGGSAPYWYQWNDYTDEYIDTTLTNSFVIEPVSTGSTVVGVYVYDALGCQAYASGFLWANPGDSLSGLVTEPNSNPVTNAQIYLIKQKLNHVGLGDTTNIFSVAPDGSFTLKNLAWGNYFLKVMADSATYPNAMPTYYSNRLYPIQWDSALVIQHHTCSGLNDAGRNVTLVEITPTSGSGHIEGYITFVPGYGSRYGSGAFPVQGAPLKGIDVKLGRNPGGSPAARTTTDTSGHYTFSNIGVGDYKIYVDIPNYGMDSARSVSITQTDTISVKNDYYVDSAMVHVVPHYYINIAPAICVGDSMFAGGAYQHTAGTYTDSLVTSLGGDSIIVTDLAVNAVPNVTASATAYTVCTGGSVTLTGGGAVNYAWSGGVTDGISFTPTQTDTFTVVGTDNNGCSDTASLIVVVEICTGSLAYSNNGISVYPNPSAALLTINAGGVPLSIEVQNVTGEKVMDIPVTGRSTQADISNLPTGAYVVKVQMAKEGIRYMKILKQ